MRYLGNKESILEKIDMLLESKGLLRQGLTFFDAFCGSGSVADHFKAIYHLIINDNLAWSVLYAKGRVCATACTFERLGFDPFDYLNGNDETRHGFMYKNYAPTESGRMYFTPENAGRIDYFRAQIEQWWSEHKLTEEEYAFLMACLIESVSDVSNTAGVYGAFLKKWDARALKKIVFSRVDFHNADCLSLTAYNSKIEEIIGDVACDILYLDPPYTQNQYGTQYHLLETLVLDDEPSISEVTGSRSTAPMRSDWSKEYKAHILFDRLLAKTRAKYIILSYNNDGFMSKEYIESAMKRYGKPETFVCKRITYKKYQNWKSQNKKKHYEYLFFVERKNDRDIVLESPLNYIGSKAKIVPDIMEQLRESHQTFVDAFGGGFNVGINARAGEVVYNDINYIVTDLIRSFRDYDTYEYLLYVKRMIKKFGLEKGNGPAYIAARNHYNSLPAEKRDPRLLFTLILYGYQQQIRFNGQHEFNNPVGMRWFNDRVLEKMISFSRKLKEGKYDFSSKSYKDLRKYAKKGNFFYFDPPYKLTTGAYNDGKRGFAGWNEKMEAELFDFADELDKAGVPFMMSYVIEHKGVKNEALLNWLERKHYRVIALGDVIGISGSRRKEVLIVNHMKFRTVPHFIIKKSLQKSKITGVYFSDVISESVLRDVCERVTGKTAFTVDFVDNDYQDEFLGATYNKGRMAILLYEDMANFISFSELKIGGRNSSVQSVPTAYNMYYSNPYPNKRLFYYFLDALGNAETDYQLLIYRLMSTIGFTFLNASPTLAPRICAFNSVEDIIFNRRINAGRNKSNNSTFITKGEHGEIEVYGKTYGANKYETSLICYALASLCRPGQRIKLYEVLEGDLKELPESSLSVIKQMGVVDVIPTDLTLEKTIYNENDSLRSPKYTYNLFKKLGDKRCALCDCEIPELIQGAHIWPVADIKRAPAMSFEQRLDCATDGENGVWLCENHHKLFDEDFFTFDENGCVLLKSGIDRRHAAYMQSITTNTVLPEGIVTERFVAYLRRRHHVG